MRRYIASMAMERLPVRLTHCLELVWTSTEKPAGESGTVRLECSEYQIAIVGDEAGHLVLH